MSVTPRLSRLRYFFKYSFREAFRLCKPPSSFAASSGSPMGLTASAMANKIRPFFTETVSSTARASRPRTALAICQRNTVREISAAQSQTSREMMQQKTTAQLYISTPLMPMAAIPLPITLDFQHKEIGIIPND